MTSVVRNTVMAARAVRAGARSALLVRMSRACARAPGMMQQQPVKLHVHVVGVAFPLLPAYRASSLVRCASAPPFLLNNGALLGGSIGLDCQLDRRAAAGQLVVKGGLSLPSLLASSKNLAKA